MNNIWLFSRSVRALFAFCVACTCVPAALHAQQARIEFRHLTQEDGLRSNRITALIQDRKGFLWVGADDGLYRYNGYSFQQFSHRAEDPHSIAEGEITYLLEDGAGVLWIGTSTGGLCRKNPASEEFETFRSTPGKESSLVDDRITSLFEDDKGTLWIGTYGGLCAFNKKRTAFTSFLSDPMTPSSLASNTVSDIAQTSDGTIWVGTSGGLCALDRGTQRFTRYQHDARISGSLTNNYVTRLNLDVYGDLWIGTMGGMLHRFNRQTNVFRAYQIPKPLKPNAILGDIVSTIFRDESGFLWVGIKEGLDPSDVKGLYRFDPESGSSVRYTHDEADPRSISGNDITVVIGDRSGMVWVGTEGHGLNGFLNKVALFGLFRHDAAKSVSLSDDNVVALSEAPDGNIWIGTADGYVNIWNRASGRFTPFNLSESGATQVTISAMAVGKDGTIWIGTEEHGLFAVDPLSKAVRRYRHDPMAEGTVASNAIKSLVVGRDGTLWIGTPGKGVAFLPVGTESFRQFKNDPSKPSSLSSDLVECMIEDKSGSVWAGTRDRGLNKLDRASGTWTRLFAAKAGDRGLRSNSINCLFQDRRGNLWAGTSDGLHMLLPDGVNFTAYSKTDGLPDDNITSILGDDDDNLWVATLAGGLCRFTPRTSTPSSNAQQGDGNPSGAMIVSFDAKDGLQGIRFNQRAAFRTSDGTMCFGGTDGLNVFQPETINRRVRPPSVRIADFQLNNRSIAPGDNSGILSVPIDDTRELVLPYDQNRITFEFTVLHFANPDKNRFAYKLEGYDSLWTFTDGQKRYATYTNLPDGQYTFRVRGASSDGIWNDNGVAIAIRITPPWYRTITAYISYAVALVLLMFAVDRLLRMRIIRKERREAVIRETELRVQTVAAQAEASEAKARALEIENERQELELSKARELEKAYAELDDAHHTLMATQAQLIHAEKMASLGQLTAGIAHEIKNPLNFVNNFAELTIGLAQEFREELESEEAKTTEQLKESISFLLVDLDMNARKIAEHGKRADGIVRSMLAHSSGKTGEKQPTDINTLLEEYVNLAWHSAKANHADFNLQIERRYNPDVGKIPALTQELARVFLNLLNNAIDALHEQSVSAGPTFHPVLTVSTEVRDREIAVLFTDNGTGIPEHIREKIFQPFFTTKPTGSGTGLGLSISYDIVVNGHNGQMLVDSTDGMGTTFSVILPRE